MAVITKEMIEVRVLILANSFLTTLSSQYIMQTVPEVSHRLSRIACSEF
jgi:hypothetical protein